MEDRFLVSRPPAQPPAICIHCPLFVVAVVSPLRLIFKKHTTNISSLSSFIIITITTLLLLYATEWEWRERESREERLKAHRRRPINQSMKRPTRPVGTSSQLGKERRIAARRYRRRARSIVYSVHTTPMQ